MNILGFKIGIENSEANQGFDDLGSRLDKIKEQTSELYEGPAREMKVRREVKGLIGDFASGKPTLDTFFETLNRLSEIGKFALPIGIGVTALVALSKAEIEAKNQAIEFLNVFRDGMQMPTDGPVKLIEETIKKLEEGEKKYGEMGWISRLMLGMEGISASSMKEQIEHRIGEAQDNLDTELAKRERNKTQALSLDPRTAAEGKKAQSDDDFDDRIAEARAKNQPALAQALESEKAAAGIEIMRKPDEADKKTKEKEDADNAKLVEFESEQGLSPMDAMKKQRDVAQARVDSDGPRSVKSGAGKRLEDEKELARLNEEIAKQETQAKEEQNKKDLAAADKIKKDKSEEVKAAFELLSKEEKVAALKLQVARLESDLKRADLTDDEKHADKLRLLHDKKTLTELQKQEKVERPHETLTGMQALTLGMNHVVHNEAAGRADQQRDQAIKLLQMIAAKNHPAFDLRDSEEF